MFNFLKDFSPVLSVFCHFLSFFAFFVKKTAPSRGCGGRRRRRKDTDLIADIAAGRVGEVELDGLGLGSAKGEVRSENRAGGQSGEWKV